MNTQTETMSHSDIDRFKKFFNNQKNFMTPDVIRYGRTKEHLFELSEGLGFTNDRIFGLTVLRIDHNNNLVRSNHSGMVHSEEEAQTVIDSLK